MNPTPPAPMSPPRPSAAGRARHVAVTTLQLAAVTALPLADRPALLLTWPVGFLIACGYVLNLSQPPVTADDLARGDDEDRFSVTLILVAGMLGFLLPVVDYGHGAQARPALLTLPSLLGVAGAAAGLALRAWSIRTLGRFFTAKVAVRDDHAVVVDGPYRLVRHPSYTGALLLVASLALVFRSPLAGVAVVGAMLPVYLYRITVEETALRARLGPAYDAYAARTWRLVPGIW